MARCFITGIAGFIGSSLAHHLLNMGHVVSGVDSLCCGDLRNLEKIRGDVDFVEADINETESLQRLCRGVDFVFHQAALASVPRSVRAPAESNAANVNGTLSVLIAARDAGVSRVIYAASSSAYGDQPTQPKHEAMLPSPMSPYAVQKLAGEHYVKAFWSVYGLEGVCLRYFNVFGPKQSADSPYSGVIARFVTDMLAGVTPTIFGDGTQSRDFTYVGNVTAANELACMAPTARVAGEVFNIGSGASQTLNALYGELSKLLRVDRLPAYAPPRVGDIAHSEADISRARESLHYEARVSFAEGLRATVAWYVEEWDRRLKLEKVQHEHSCIPMDADHYPEQVTTFELPV